MFAPALKYKCAPGLLICRHLLPWNTWKTKFSTLTFCCCSTNLERSLCRRYCTCAAKSWVGEKCVQKGGKTSSNSQMSYVATSAWLWGKRGGKGLRKKKRRKKEKGMPNSSFTFLHTPTLVNSPERCGLFIVYYTVLLLQPRAGKC